MSKILKFKAKPVAKYLKVDSLKKIQHQVREEHPPIDNKNQTNNLSPQFTLADDQSIYAYYQLTKAAELDKTLDTALRLKGAAIVTKVKTIAYEQIQKTIDSDTAILLHDHLTETGQRVVNCLSPSTYVCPRKHTQAEQWKMISWLTGRFETLLFDENGILVQRIEFSEQKNRIIEIPANVYHSFVALEPCSYLEIRNYAYQEETDRVYASWAALENNPKKLAYSQLLHKARVGDSLTLGDLHY